ncbi:hypothetical protein F5X98DRAFT_87017 [Xylaria grammica]|nr:hypothetical protein F5X98DRAFT_87017 [Xylaria grammica]
MPPGLAEDALAARQLLRFIDTGHPSATLVTDQDISFARYLAPELNRQTQLEEDFPLSWAESQRRFNTFLRRWRGLHATHRADNHGKNEIPSRPAGIPSKPAGIPPEPTGIPSKLTNIPSEPQIESKAENFGGRHLPEPVPAPEHLTLPKLAITPHDTEQPPSARQAATNLSAESQRQLEDLAGQLGRFHMRSPSSSLSPIDTPPGASEDSLDIPQHPTPLSPAMAVPLTIEDAQRLLQEAMTQQNNNMARLLAAARQDAPPNPAPAPATLRSSDVGYFDPAAKDPTAAGIIADGKITKYTDVFAFTDRLKHLAAQQGEAEVRKVWTQCLLGPALVWHSQVLSSADRELLETATIQAICNKLTDRFKPSWSTAMSRLQSYQFTLEDVYKGRDILSFVQRVIRDAKGCDQNDTNQLKAAFEAFDGDIQSQLTVPSETTTVDTFLTQIREREGVLKKMAKDKLTSPRSAPTVRSWRWQRLP